MKGVIDSLVAGSMTGCLIRACTCPLDVLKIRLQLQLEPIHQVGITESCTSDYCLIYSNVLYVNNSRQLAKSNT